MTSDHEDPPIEGGYTGQDQAISPKARTDQANTWTPSCAKETEQNSSGLHGDGWSTWIPASSADDSLLTGFRQIVADKFDRDVFAVKMREWMTEIPMGRVSVYNYREPGEGDLQLTPYPDYRTAEHSHMTGDRVFIAGSMEPRQYVGVDGFPDYIVAPPRREADTLESHPTTYGPCKTCQQPNDYERRTEIHFLQRALANRNKMIAQLNAKLAEVGKMFATEKRSNMFFKSTLDIALKRQTDDALHITHLSKQVADAETRLLGEESISQSYMRKLMRRHDSSCSKEGELACETCPECHLGFYDDDGDDS